MPDELNTQLLAIMAAAPLVSDITIQAIDRQQADRGTTAPAVAEELTDIAAHFRQYYIANPHVTDNDIDMYLVTTAAYIVSVLLHRKGLIR